MGLRDKVAAATDVQTETVFIEEWDADIEFRGLSYAALTTLQGASLKAAQEGDLDSAIDLLAAVMADPETHELVFNDDEGKSVLRQRSQKAISACMNVALRVLGIDEADTAGKD